MNKNKSTQEPSIKLISAATLLNTSRGRPCANLMESTATWCKKHLCSPHPSVGRTGPLCPWVPTAFKLDTLWLTTLEFKIGEQNACVTFHELISIFKQLKPTAGRHSQFKAIVCLLEDSVSSVEIDALHSKLKCKFLAEGLMLGEFYPSCVKPGLRNKSFLPLQSETPMIVIREMVEIDIVFLADDPEFIRLYLMHFMSAGNDAIKRILADQKDFNLKAEEIVNLEKATKTWNIKHTKD